MNEASLDARKATVLAMSSAVPAPHDGAVCEAGLGVGRGADTVLKWRVDDASDTTDA